MEGDWIIEAIRALGIAGGPVFAALWFLERKERIDCQRTTKDLLVQTLTVTAQAAASIVAVRDAVAELRESSKDSVRTISQLIRSIGKVGG